MTTKKSKTAATAPIVQPSRELKAFYHGQPTDDFSGVRFYWPAGEGARDSIGPKLLKKRRPASAESEVDTAAKVEVLLRPEIGEDYTDPDFLARSYEQKLANDETAAFAQVTMRFPHATNLHGPYHIATSWLRSYYVEPFGVPVIAILHAPFLAASEASIHVHGLILMKRLSPFGWLTMHKDLASDAGFQAAKRSWMCTAGRSILRD